MSNLRSTLALSVILVSAICAVQSYPTESVEGASDQSNGSISAISVIVYVTPVEAMDVDFVTFTYNVVNGGTAYLCNITINNSISGVEFVELFDLKPGENATRTAEYELTPEDRKLPYLSNWISATGYDCENGCRTAAATAGCSILLS